MDISENLERALDHYHNPRNKELVQTRPRCATLGLDAFRAAAREFLRQQRLATHPDD